MTPLPRSQGQATVEVVLALPVVVALLLLVIQVALVAQAQVAVVNAAREGARAAAVEGTEAAVTRAVHAAPGLRAGAPVEVATSMGETARVRVRYAVPTDVPIVGALLGDPVVEAEVAMRVEQPDG